MGKITKKPSDVLQKVKKSVTSNLGKKYNKGKGKEPPKTKTERQKQTVERQPKQSPKILLHDIEAGPNLGYVYGKYETNVMKFDKEWELMAYGFKWLGRRAVESYGQNTHSEEELVGMAHELLDEADIVIAHNGDRFDQKMLNAKFIEYSFDPPSPYRSIDTLKVARRYFRFTSNSLGDLAEKLGVQRKADLGGFAVWLACIEGDEKAWKKLISYNKQDVRVLEDLYIKLRPWMDNHPALNVIGGEEFGCPKCNSTNMHKRGTLKANKTTTVQRYQCQDCGGWSQDRYSQKSNVRFTN